MRLLLSIVLCTTCTVLLAQHQEVKSDQSALGHNGHALAHHMVQVVLGHTHITDGRNADGEKEWLALPSFGLNYNYKIDNHWLVGLHTDIILENFKVELEEDMAVVERAHPVAVTLLGGYKTRSPFTFLLGGGIEFEQHKNIGFVRLGVEPGWHFGEGKWEVSVVLEYEIKFHHYNSWVLGFGIARLF